MSSGRQNPPFLCPFSLFRPSKELFDAHQHGESSSRHTLPEKNPDIMATDASVELTHKINHKKSTPVILALIHIFLNHAYLKVKTVRRS